MTARIAAAALPGNRLSEAIPARPLQRLHRLIMAIISRMPLARQFSWRAYNYVLMRTGVKRYLACTYFGAMIDCDLNDLIQRMIFYFGVWEPEITCLIQQRLRSGGTFLDIGANIGYDTLLAASCVGPGGHVIAIEASPPIFALLKTNLQRNRCRNVTALNAAVNDTEGKIALYEGPSRNIGMTTTMAERGFSHLTDVDGAPLEKLLDPQLLKRVTLIKIDVEGVETRILSHLLNTLNRYADDVEIIVELAQANSEKDWQQLDKLLAGFRAAGFYAYSVTNNYDVDWYLAWRAPSRPIEIASYPHTQSDVLLTRSKL